MHQMFAIVLKGLTTFSFNNVPGNITGVDMRITNDKVAYDSPNP